jgi:hypothetical protein
MAPSNPTNLLHQAPCPLVHWPLHQHPQRRATERTQVGAVLLVLHQLQRGPILTEPVQLLASRPRLDLARNLQEQVWQSPMEPRRLHPHNQHCLYCSLQSRLLRFGFENFLLFCVSILLCYSSPKAWHRMRGYALEGPRHFVLTFLISLQSWEELHIDLQNPSSSGVEGTGAAHNVYIPFYLDDYDPNGCGLLDSSLHKLNPSFRLPAICKHVSSCFVV